MIIKAAMPLNSKKFFSVVELLLRVLPNWRRRLSILFVCALTEVAIVIAVPLQSARIIDSLHLQDRRLFLNSFLIVVFLIICQSIFGYVNRYLHLCLEEQVGKGLRHLIIRSVLFKPLAFFEKYWVGDILSRTVNDSSQVKRFLTASFLQFIIDGLTIILVCFVLLSINPVLAVMVIFTAPATIIYGGLIRHRMEKMNLLVRENIAGLISYLQTWMNKALSIKAYIMETTTLRRFSKKNGELTRNIVSLGVLRSFSGSIIMLLSSLPSLAVLGYGGFLTFRNDLSVGDLFAFTAYSAYFNAPIQRVMTIWLQNLPMAYSVHSRLTEFLIASPGSNCIQINVNKEGVIDKIALRQVRFVYDGSVNFKLNVPEIIAYKGETVLVTGKNGSGKSTLLKLIAGLYSPTSGEIVAEFHDRKNKRSRQILNCVAYLPQNPHIFDGTLSENITLFEKKVDVSRLEAIADALDMHAWLDALPDGWNEKLNTGSLKSLSGGQIQQIGLARIFYRRSSILALDEPYHYLDDALRSKLTQLLLEMKEDKLIFIVTHALPAHLIYDHIYHMVQYPDSENNFLCIANNESEHLI